jgi:hypothetical protein
MALSAALLLTLFDSRSAEAQTACGSLQCITLSAEVFRLDVLTQVTTSGSASFDISPGSGFTATNFGGATSGAWNVPTGLTVTARTNSSSNVRLYLSRSSGSTGCTIATTDITYGTGTTAPTNRNTALSTAGSQIINVFKQTSGVSATVWFRVAGMTWAGDPPAACSLPITFSVRP